MNIDRHNYEEWFLLYADDELSAAERREVEAFMERNPDLAGELEIFRQMKLDPSEELTFTGKASLYRQEEESVEEEDSMLLSYLDGELHGEALAAAERRLATEPALAVKLEQFRLAVLPAEPLVFADKASLYRKHERTTPIISMRWMRVAVAAAIIISGGVLWLNQQSAVTPKTIAGLQSTVNSNQSAVNRDKPVVNNDKPELVSAPVQPTTDNARPTTAIQHTGSRIQDPAVTNAPLDRNKEGSRNEVAVNNVNVQPKRDNGLPTPDNRQPMTDNQQPITSTDVAVNTPAKEEAATEIVDRPSVNTVAKSDYATQALLNPDRQDEPVLDEGNRTRKGPFRGLVRKANRFFNKATNPDPDKATVKVASFEIALGR